MEISCCSCREPVFNYIEVQYSERQYREDQCVVSLLLVSSETERSAVAAVVCVCVCVCVLNGYISGLMCLLMTVDG